MLKNSENEILSIESPDFLMIFLARGIRKQSPEFFNKVIEEAFLLPDLETELAVLEAEFEVTKDLHKVYNPRWKYASNLERDERVQFIEEVIEQVGSFYGAILKLEKEVTELESALEH